MKKSSNIFFAIAFVFFCSNAFASEIEAKSEITKVCVYPDSALVTRTASLKLSAGEYKIIFPDIIPEVDENSLKLSGQGTAGVKLFGAQVKKEFLENPPSERVKQLKEEIQDLQDELRNLEGRKQQLFNSSGSSPSVKTGV